MDAKRKIFSYNFLNIFNLTKLTHHYNLMYFYGLKLTLSELCFNGWLYFFYNVNNNALVNLRFISRNRFRIFNVHSGFVTAFIRIFMQYLTPVEIDQGTGILYADQSPRIVVDVFHCNIHTTHVLNLANTLRAKISPENKNKTSESLSAHHWSSKPTISICY